METVLDFVASMPGLRSGWLPRWASDAGQQAADAGEAPAD